MTPRPKPERPRKDAMKNRDAPYFPLSLDSLRAIGGWAADGAERALPVFKRCANSDPRPRAAIEGIQPSPPGKTGRPGRAPWPVKRMPRRGTDPPAAAAAALAAGHAAASAYTHPLADVQQTLHIVGSAAYAALALELDGLGHSAIGDAVVRLLVQQAPPAVRDVLRQMPARTPRNSRLAQLLYSLDSTIRARS